MTLSSRAIGVLHDVTRSEAPVLAYKSAERAALVTCSYCMTVVRANGRKYWDYTGEAWTLHEHQPGRIAYEVVGDMMADGSERKPKARKR